MSNEPITIFSYKVDPKGVYERLKGASSNLEIKGSGDGWSLIQLKVDRGFLRKPATLTFRHSRSYYSSSEFHKQLSGMQAYFSKLPQTELSPRIMTLIENFRFALLLHPEPVPELDLGSDDERLKYLFAVVKHLDGVIFTPTSLRDAQGRILCSATAKPDPAAVMPMIYKNAPSNDATGKTSVAVVESTGPSRDRVARRALVLAIVVFRCVLEDGVGKGSASEKSIDALVKSVDLLGLTAEIEPDEADFVNSPPGSCTENELVEWMCRLEGLAILTWALQRFSLGPLDKATDPNAALHSVGALDRKAALQFLAETKLRPSGEIQSMSRQLRGIHWRLREFSEREQAVDFPKFAGSSPFGLIPLQGIPIMEDDLAIGGVPITKAPPELVERSTRIAEERHLAINWICGVNKIYSQTPTPT